MTGKSATQNSLEFLRSEGYECEVVEYWNSFTKRRHDLFGIIDIMALKGSETLAVQTTSRGCVSARKKKITESPFLNAIRAANWTLHIHGWRKELVKKGGKAMVWKHNTIDMS